jgi:hypothetical protein
MTMIKQHFWIVVKVYHHACLEAYEHPDAIAILLLIWLVRNKVDFQMVLCYVQKFELSYNVLGMM